MKRNRKITAAVLAVIVIMSSFSGFTYYDGIGNVYLDSEKKIFDGAVYREQIAVNSSNGAEKAYFVEADLDGALDVMVFNGEVRSTATVGTMIKYAEEQGYKVLAAINGDIYDTASGTPKGLVIHSGNIVTSGYNPDRVIAFDSEGKASMQYVNLTYGLHGTLAYDEVQQVPVTDENGNPTGETTTQAIHVESSFKSNIDFVNVPHGASNGLHLYNRHYGTSTKTAGSCIEVVIDCGSTDNMQLQVGKTIHGTVKAVNVDACNTPIGENEIVLSTVSGSASASKLYCMIVGSQVEINVTDNNNNLSDTKEAIGFYYSLLEDGKVVTSGTGLNPRTALGIKADGSIVLYAVDGRQTDSKGLNLVQLANHMKALGCEYAFNMDGGGSTALYSRLPGIESTAALKNTPSGSSERKVANAVLLVYKEKGSSSAENLNVYPSMTLLMPGASVQMSSYASNELFEKVTLTGSVDYEVTNGDGDITAKGLYTAGDKEGVEIITATSGNISGETKVQVVKSGLTLTPSVAKLYINANESSDINISAKSGPIDVVSNDNIFTWSCDENIGTIDENGVFKAGSKNAETGNIYVKYEDYNITIPVQVGQLSVDFADTTDHWARTYIGSLAARGMTNGMGDNLYMPDAQLTRAQFLAFLAKTLEGTDITKSTPAGFTDVPETEWYYNYVNWGYENGIVSGTGENLFEPNANITREQMCIMLCNFAESQDFQLPQNAELKTFTDQSAISVWAADYVNTIVKAGIISGQPEGDFQPQGLATRAQAAKVVYVYLNLKAGIQ